MNCECITHETEKHMISNFLKLCAFCFYKSYHERHEKFCHKIFHAFELTTIFLEPVDTSEKM